MCRHDCGHPWRGVTERSVGLETGERWRRVPRRGIGLLALALAGALGAACTGQQSGRARPDAPLIAVPPRNSWPPQFQQASPEAQQAYRFAVAHLKVLQYMPCYCGCGSIGHTSNKDCYIREVRPDGAVVLDPHGFG
jgi:hypothetical protein